jgi:hypothetical protein
MAFRNLQVVYRDAGLRSVMNPFILNQLQETPASALLAYNLAVKVPKLPLELYANGVARFQSGSATVTYLDAESGIQQLAIPQFMGEAGVALTLANGAVKINANALQSAFLRPNAYHQAQSPRWFEYLSWSVDLKKLNLYDLVRNTRLG